MLPIDLDRVRCNVEEATTEDLLDRATVYRNGMEVEAVEIVEDELRERGITAKEIAAHADQRANTIRLSDGTVQECSFCRCPAIAQGWGWRQLRHARGFGVLLWWLPIPWFSSYCERHAPSKPER